MKRLTHSLMLYSPLFSPCLLFLLVTSKSGDAVCYPSVFSNEHSECETTLWSDVNER